MKVKKGQFWYWERRPKPGKVLTLQKMSNTKELEKDDENHFSTKWGVRKGYVYLASCPLGLKYVGSTNNPPRRIKEHVEGLHASNKMKDWMKGNITWTIIEEFHYINKKTLTDREYY